MATLYIVATPIGNLQDITLRALEVLRSADIIACEDTRRTGKLLRHFDIRKRLLSCRARNERVASERILQVLKESGAVAYVTDAGTPGLSDPGAVLAREARAAGHAVVPIPGASAFAALLSVGGFGGKTVVFDGFLSPKAGRRQNRLKELLGFGAAFVLYESPHRIVKLLWALAELDDDREVLVGREMTKAHEEYLTGNPSFLAEALAVRESVKGELSVLVGPRKKS